MGPGIVASALLRGIDNYRASTIHPRVGHRCRMAPSCSYYAEDALLTRSLPVAVLLVVRRLLRCTPRVPLGTYDPVPRPVGRRWLRRGLGVVVLSAITTLIVSGTASALSTYPTLVVSASTTDGGCDAFVGGVPVGSLTSDHPLHVHEGQAIVVTGLAPTNLRSISSVELHSTTDVQVVFVEKVFVKTWSEQATGTRFQRSVNVDSYLKFGSGLYGVNVHSFAPAPGWDCKATFYVELHGSKLAMEVAVAVGGIGAVGVALSKGDTPPADAPPPSPDSLGLYDPGIAPDTLERLQAKKDTVANAAATGTVGCLAAILFALIASTGAFAATVPPDLEPKRRVVWVRGHPVLGAISGLFAGLGATVALQQLGFYPFTITSAIVAPLLTAAFGGWRGWRGCAWRLA